MHAPATNLVLISGVVIWCAGPVGPDTSAPNGQPELLQRFVRPELFRLANVAAVHAFHGGFFERELPTRGGGVLEERASAAGAGARHG